MLIHTYITSRLFTGRKQHTILGIWLSCVEEETTARGWRTVELEEGRSSSLCIYSDRIFQIFFWRVSILMMSLIIYLFDDSRQYKVKIGIAARDRGDDPISARTGQRPGDPSGKMSYASAGVFLLGGEATSSLSSLSSRLPRCARTSKITPSALFP